MKHLKNFKPKEEDLSKFAPIGTKDCENKCARRVIMTKNGPVIACDACKRIVMDNRDNK